MRHLDEEETAEPCTHPGCIKLAWKHDDGLQFCATHRLDEYRERARASLQAAAWRQEKREARMRFVTMLASIAAFVVALASFVLDVVLLLRGH